MSDLKNFNKSPNHKIIEIIHLLLLAGYNFICNDIPFIDKIRKQKKYEKIVTNEVIRTKVSNSLFCLAVSCLLLVAG